MVNCVVVGCSNRTRKKPADEKCSKVSFFLIPKVVTNQCEKMVAFTSKRRAEWFRRIRRADINESATHYRVCGDHFISGRPAYVMSDTDPDWAPSLKLGYGKPADEAALTARHSRVQSRAKNGRAPTEGCEADAQDKPALPDEDHITRGDCSMDFTDSQVSSGACPVEAGSIEGTSQCSATATDFTDSQVSSGACPVEAGSMVGTSQCSATATGFLDSQVSSGACPMEARSMEGTSQWSATAADVQDFGQTTDLTMASIELLEAESRHLMSDLGATREQLSVHRLDETSFQKDKGMVPFYTGLPSFALLLGLFQLLQGSVRHSERNSLSKFQEMIVFLVRLRLNLPLQDLAYRFQVSQSTITRIVDKWLDAAYLKLPKAVKWPGRDVLRKSMPMAFRRTFGTRVAVILDCFEVFIDRPSSLHARALTWSSYKHHNTVKYLIGIAPQGKITFISKGWGGRTSDKHLTEQCGVLDNLLPGDSVLADRGFTISDAVSVHCARLEIPAFTRGKAQLAPCAIEATRNLANVRIHVERVIGLVRRKYRILKSTIPVELLVVRSGNATGLDKIVAVCAALTNMSPSVVPFG